MCKAMVLSMTAGVYTLNKSARRQVGGWLPHIRSPRLTAVEGQLACAKRVLVVRVDGVAENSRRPRPVFLLLLMRTRGAIK
jgi:hypothetical protein